MKFEKQKRLLQQREAANAFRFLKTREGLVDFSSNDYLGISKNGIQLEDEFYAKGSGGSRLLAGNYAEVEAFESFLVSYHASESALVFNSGYNANVGFFSVVPQRGDTIIYDELIHASVKDGMRMSFARSFSFNHNDIDDLGKKVERATGDVYIAVEAVYSMDGDEAPLKGLVDLCNTVGACLVVDEAHSIGVYGKGGRGLVQELGLESEVPVRILTFGKAPGAHGAAVLGSRVLIDFLINYARSFIYTTALPVYVIKSLEMSYASMKEGEHQNKLRNNITFFKQEAKKLGLEGLINSNSAIQCVVIPGINKVKKVAERLVEDGLDVHPVLSPTVPEGKERIRICLHAFNTKEDILKLINGLKQYV